MYLLKVVFEPLRGDSHVPSLRKRVTAVLREVVCRVGRRRKRGEGGEEEKGSKRRSERKEREG